MDRGSEWRKWDLHFHTPSSYDYEDKTVTNEDIIRGLSQKGISVVAITDHHYIDVSRIQELQNIGKDYRITVLPGIEFLSDSRGRQPIHFIGIFSQDCNIEYIWGQLSNITNISKIKGEGKRENEVYCELDKTLDLIKSLGGISTIHAGQKSNSIENITHSLEHGAAQKTEIANKIDFYELGKPEDKKGYINIVFKHIGKHIPMIICSDNHNINKYELKENCWIKADPTFEGLKQVIYEPKHRVRIQAIKPNQKPGYKVIDSVKIQHSDFYPQTIKFNQNLNSIIGGRSTGKSVLLGAIAKKLNSDKDVKFDNEKYTQFVNEIVSSIVVTWKDEVENNDRDIEYFPQSYMYTLARNREKELDRLVENIIRQDPTKNQLLSSYSTFSSENSTQITSRINKLFQFKEEINKRKSILKEKGDVKGIKAEIEKLSIELGELKNKVDISEEELNKYSELREEKVKISKSNEILTDEINRITSLKDRFFINRDINAELVSLTEENRILVKKKFEELSKEFQSEWENSIKSVLSSNLEKRKQYLEKVDEIEKDTTYQKGLEVFQNDNQYKDVEAKLKRQENRLADVMVVSREIQDFHKQVDSFKASIKEMHREFYNQINTFKPDLSLSRGDLEIRANPEVAVSRYKELLKNSINQQGYQGQQIVGTEINTVEDYFQSINVLFDKLLNEQVTLKRQYTPSKLCLDLMPTNFFDVAYDISYDDNFDKMSEGKKAFVVLLLLLDFSNKDCPILIDQPEDDLDNRAIYKDLVTYLLKKKKERQIILVTHNPNIVVGGDSELVIVANQHGVNSPNRADSKFQYKTGSLEDTKAFDKSIKFTLESQGIREHVCEILEGGDEAFKRRELKYSLGR